MGLNLVRLLTVLVAALLPLAGAIAQNAIEGTISYDAESVAMIHVSARETRPRPDSEDQPRIVILIADRVPPADVAASRQAYYRAARDGRISGLQIELQPPSSEARMTIVARGGGVDDAELPELFPRVELTDLSRDGGWVSGRLRTTEPGEFTGGGGGAGEPSHYSIDVRFRVAIVPAPTPSEILTEEAARHSEQAAAALAALRFLRTGSIAEIRARLHPDNPAWAALGTAQGAGFLAALRRALPTPETYLQSIQRVVVYGDEAIVVARDSGGTNRISLRRDGGAWKLAASLGPDD